jgi:2-polyprenyl-3-methyl-5-hydroxy-6-metoxy-1,4-benzoquinol methylase
MSDEIAIVENGYSGRRCVQCGIIWISPRPSPSEISELYSDSHAAIYADAQLHFEQFKRMEAREALRAVKRYKEKGDLLELGAGGGAFLAEARNAGFSPYAIELNPVEAGWIKCNLNIPCESAALSTRTHGGRKFDVIYHRDVLSHLNDPVETFSLVNLSLKDDGIVVFETGNIADVNQKFFPLFAQFLYPDHLYFFGEKSLRLLLERTGFECLDIKRRSIALPLLVRKLLWKVKDHLKDSDALPSAKAATTLNDRATRKSSMKRKLRLLYRYAYYYLGKLGKPLARKGWPLEFLVVARKKPSGKPSGETK